MIARIAGSDAPARATLARAADLPLPARIVALSASGPMGEAPFRAAVEEKDADWNAVLWVASHQRAVAPLYRRLAATTSACLALEPVRRMGQLALVSEFQLEFLHQQLAETLRVLAAASIDVLLLKGAGLAYSVYERPSARPMADVDLLVHPDRAREAWSLALRHGWARRADVPEEQSYDDHQHLPPLEDASGMQLGLEVHTALFIRESPFRFSAADLWEQARPLDVAGHRVLVPSAEHQLLHCCLHFAWSHEMNFGAWRTLRDVVRLVESGAIDWNSFVRAAERSRGGSCCYWTLRLAHDLAHAEVPSGALAALAPRRSRWTLRAMSRQFARQAFPLPHDGEETSVSVSRMLWSLGIRPRAYGHGAARPWLDDLAVPVAELPAGSSPARRVVLKSLRAVRVMYEAIRP